MAINTDFLKAFPHWFSPDLRLRVVIIASVFVLLAAAFSSLIGGFALLIGMGMSGMRLQGIDVFLAFGLFTLIFLFSATCFVAVSGFVRRRAWAYWFTFTVLTLVALASIGTWMVGVAPAFLDRAYGFINILQWILELVVTSVILALPALLAWSLFRYRGLYFTAGSASSAQQQGPQPATQTSHVDRHYEVLVVVIALLLAVPVVLQGMLGDIFRIPTVVGILGVVAMALLLYPSSSIRLLYIAGAALLLSGIVIEALGPHAEDVLTPTPTYYVNGLLHTSEKTLTRTDPAGSFVIAAGALILIWVYFSTRRSEVTS